MGGATTVAEKQGKTFEQIFREALDESIRQVVEETARLSDSSPVEGLHVSASEILEDQQPETLLAGLEQLLGSGAPRLHRLIVQNLSRRLGLTSPAQDRTLGDDLHERSRDLLTVVLPALNEATAVGPVIDELRAAGYERILLVDGHSRDDTVAVARERGVTVITQEGVGKVGAIRTAIQRVKTPYLLVMDCDATYDPQDIERLVDSAEGCDLVIGARREGRSNISPLNRFGNWVISTAFKYLLGADVSDVCSGMYLLRTAAAQELDLTTKGFAVEVDLASQLSMQGRIGEVPITIRKRVGRSKLSRWDGFKILFNVFSLARRYNPMFLFAFLALAAGVPAALILPWVIYEAVARGVWHSGYALFGGILALAAFQSFTLAALSVLIKRMEKRIERRLQH